MRRAVSGSEDVFYEPLKPREQEILALLEEKYSNQEIAEQLYLALSTVKWYVRQIYQKLGVKNRRQAVAKAKVAGILDGSRRANNQEHHLPAQVTPFIGRKAELDSLLKMLNDPTCRLLTLLGPGGYGKTRLAIELAYLLDRETGAGPRFQDGIFFFPLAPIHSAQSLLPLILTRLQLPVETNNDPLARLAQFLSGKQLLFILDSFEHLVNRESIQFLAELLNAAPRLSVLVTSRMRLGMQGEHVYPVPGMDTMEVDQGMPDGILWEKASSLDSVQLFQQAAIRVRPDFMLTEDNVPQMLQICQYLQGIPLAIVLAATWVRILPSEQILTEIQRSIDFLESDWLDLPERQRSLSVVLQASWKLLTQEEQVAAGKLSLFRGPFTSAQAREVFSIPLKILGSLLDKSWLQHEPEDRFTLHELMRHFANDQLHQEEAAFRVAQVQFNQHYLEFLRAHASDWRTIRHHDTLVLAEREFLNIEAAWQSWVEGRDRQTIAEVLNCCCRYFEAAGDYRSGEIICKQAVDVLGGEAQTDQPMEPHWQHAFALAQIWQSHFGRDWDTARQVFERNRAVLSQLARSGEDTREDQAFLHELMGLLYFDSNRSRAREQFQLALDLYAALEEDWGVALMYSKLGDLDWAEGAYEPAQEKLTRSLSIQKQVGDMHGAMWSMNNLGLINRHLGQLEAAEQLQQSSLALADAWGNPLDVASMTSNLAHLLVFLGHPSTGYEKAFESIAILDELQFPHEIQAAAYGAAAHAALHLGRYTQVHELVEASIEIGKSFHLNQDVGLDLFFQGCALFAEGRFEEARRQFQNSHRLLLQIHQNFSGIAQTGLALVAMQNEDVSLARLSLKEAFTDALQRKAFIPAIYALPVAGLWFVGQGDHRRALQLSALSVHYPFVSHSRWFSQVAVQKIAQAVSGISFDDRPTSKLLGQEMEFWDVVTHIIYVLKEH